MKALIILMAMAMVVFLAADSFAAGTYQMGMSKQEVIELLGQPVSKDIHGAYERWEYKLQGDITEVLYFSYGRLVQMTRWATDSEGRKLRVTDILSIAYKKCSVWHILPFTPSYLISLCSC
jgi:outer membrane protein assembly factor BamE (lipoprotein component of BamABCDE complex)